MPRQAEKFATALNVAPGSDGKARGERGCLLALAITGIAAAAVGLRSWRLGDRSLWFDEAFSWRLASFSWGEMLHRATLDNNPPLYYVLLKVWMLVFGKSAVALRSFSVLGGALTCVGMYLLVVEAYHGCNRFKPSDVRRMGLFTGALVATSVLQIRWGWEARMYTLGTALASLATWLLLRALRERRPSWRRWLLYAAVALAFVYTHTFAIFSLAAHALFIGGCLLAEVGGSASALWRSRRARMATMSAIAITAGCLPWLPVAMRQQAQVGRAFHTPPLTWWTLPQICHQMFVNPEFWINDGHHVEALLVTATCGGVLLALLYRAQAGDWLVLLSATVPLVVGVLASSCGRNILTSRYLIFAHLFVLAAIARFVARLPGVSERGVVAALVLSNFVWLQSSFRDYIDVRQKPGARAAAKYIERNRDPGAPIVVSSPFFFLPVLYHLNDRAGCRLFDDGHEFLHYEGTAALKETDFITTSRLPLLQSPQVWVVNNHSPGFWGRAPLPVPRDWREVARETFPDVYRIQGTIEVRAYRAK